jgi:hypothetical protein
VFLPEIRRAVSNTRHHLRRNLTVAAAAFLLGALPLVLYNIRRPNRTLSENTQLDLPSVPGKWIQVKRALNGSALFGFLVSEEWAQAPKQPATAVGRASVWLRDHLGERRESYFYYVFGALLLAAPWWWRRRAARFSLVFLAVAWLAMAVTHDAGGSAHHVALLWPFPVLFAVVALDSLPWRKVAIVLGVSMVLLNLSVVNQYLAQFARNGAEGGFTDAIFPLSTTLAESGKRVYIADWGMFDALVLMQQGRLDQHVIDTGTTSEQIGRVLADADALIVDHVRERETYPEIRDHLDRAAEAWGYRKEMWRTIEDSNGRPVFEVWKISPR